MVEVRMFQPMTCPRREGLSWEELLWAELRWYRALSVRERERDDPGYVQGNPLRADPWENLPYYLLKVDAPFCGQGLYPMTVWRSKEALGSPEPGRGAVVSESKRRAEGNHWTHLHFLAIAEQVQTLWAGHWFKHLHILAHLISVILRFRFSF